MDILQVEQLEIKEVTRLKEELKEVKKELNCKNEVLSELKNSIGNIYFVLDEWDKNYSFAFKPCPIKAVNFGKNKVNYDDIQGMKSAQWYYDYNKIYNLVSIGLDYSIKAKGILEDISI